ncbi:unnamed protein product [Aphis gossypii]|uniref:Polyprenal reductase n=1 Tax=Aphis gossypii TaxID=80765 RepID=A0A9P0J0K9_APHGO|nr:unnamed protein product [Aphis gossypii]
MDAVNAMFVAMTFAFVAVPLLLKSLDPNRLPAAVARLYAYGKITGGARPSGVLSVPKRWYRHFYAFSLALAVAAALALSDAYAAGAPWPAAASLCRRWLWDPVRRPEPSYSAAAASVAVGMFVVQCARRTYETYRVNVFSDTAVGLWYYASGYMHYAGAVVTVLAEAPVAVGQAAPSSGPWEPVRLAGALLVFGWAYRQQWRANVALAGARKRGGRVVTHEHVLLTGGLFDLVSSPQMLAEVVIYGAWYAVLWGGSGMEVRDRVRLGQSVRDSAHQPPVVQGQVQGLSATEESHHTVRAVISVDKHNNNNITILL